MAYDAKTERLISIKKLSGKAQTSNLKGLIGETKPSGLTVSFETVFGESIPTTPAPNTDALYTILGTGDGQVEYLRFPTTFIPGTVDDDGGRSGFQLALPATYEDDSSNPNKGTYPYINGQTINITSGSLQLLPPSFAVGYEARPFYGGGTTKDSGDRIYLTDIRDWYLDYFNGVFFQQDPPGAGDHANNPDFVQGYLYIGKYLSDTSGGGGTPGGSDTEVQFNDGDEFGGDSTFTFNKTTSTLTVTNLTGSLTKLSDGTSYLIAGNHISIYTGSSGAVTVNAMRAPGSIGRTKATYPITTDITAGTTFNAASNDFNKSGFEIDLIDVYTNGQLLISGTLAEVNSRDADYTITGIDTLKFGFDLAKHDIVSVTSFTSGSDTLTDSKYTMVFNEAPSGTIDGINTVFYISAAPSPSGAIMVYLNGQLLTLNTDYTVNTTQITLTVTPELDDLINVTYQKDTP